MVDGNVKKMRTQNRNANYRPSLVIVGSLGILLQGVDIFMVPGAFGFEFAMSILVMFGIGLVIAVLAGLFYVRYDPQATLGFKTVMLSLPVFVFWVGTVGLFVVGFLNYTPTPKR